MTADRTIRGTLTICAGVLAAAGLYFARPIFAPVAFALFAITIVWPFQKWLQARMPRLVALLFSLLAVLVVVTTLSYMIAWGFGTVGQWLIRNAARFGVLYAQGTQWLEEHGILVVGPLAERFDVMWLVRVVQEIATRLNSLVGFSLLVLVFMMLGLLEAGDFTKKLRSLENQERAQMPIGAGEQIAVKFRKYMLVRSLASVMTGVATWAFAYLAGIELAAAWGVIAFSLNYVPFIGPFVATVLPALFATAQLESWQMGMFVILGLSVIQFLIGSYLEPLLAGATLTISPFVVVFAVFFWSFMWGIPGAIIGVPLMIACLTICEKYPSSRWIAVMLSGSPSKQANP
jgi:AI-2 transport protein TqsA